MVTTAEKGAEGGAERCVNTDPQRRTNTGYLLRTQPPSLEFGRGSKAGREVGKICHGKKGRFLASSDHRQSTETGSGLARSRGPHVIRLGSLFGFLSQVPGWEWELKTGKLAVIDPAWTLVGRCPQVVWFGFSDWPLQRLGVALPSSSVVRPLVVPIVRLSLSTYGAFTQQVFLEGLLQVLGSRDTAGSRAEQTSWAPGRPTQCHPLRAMSYLVLHGVTASAVLFIQISHILRF